MKKTAVANFFKAKAKKPQAAPAPAQVSAESARALAEAIGYNIDATASGWDDGPSGLDDDFGLGGDRGATGVEEAVRAHLKVHVADMDDADAMPDEDAEVAKRVEKEDWEKNRRAAAKAAKKAAAAADGGAAVEAAPAIPEPVAASGPAPGSWKAKLEARKRVTSSGVPDTEWQTVTSTRQAVKDGKVMSADAMAFPTLGGPRGGPAPAKPKKPAAGAWGKTAAVAASDDLSSDEEEEEEAQPAASAGGAAAASASAPAAAAAAGADTGLLVTGSVEEVKDEEGVKKAATFIVQEFIRVRDSAEALRRFTEIRCTPLSLRQAVVEAVLIAGLDNCTNMSEKLIVGKLLSLLVPGRVVTRAQLVNGVADLMSVFDDLKGDYPKAAKDLADMCGNGLVFGTLKSGAFASTGPGIPGHDAQAQKDAGYVAVGYIAPPVAAEILGVDRAAAGKLLTKVEDEEEAAPAPAAAAAASSGAAAPAPAAAAAPAPAPEAAPAKTAAAAEEDEDGEGLNLAGAKKKKKKKALVLEEDE